MKIKYVHASEPDVEKIYDTEKSLKNNPMVHMSQEEWDKHELKSMEDNKAAGHVLSYEVLTEE